ncbi:MAG: 3-oxoacyl-[acyl-carrier-protein] reductase [Eubacteriaceae bacterium]|nr:3-oxoacyl-[acyl-carrier-protein] reductase [Eubacteriaceae bacterium]
MLKGRSAVITGGIRGIGKGIAKMFCMQGADVMLVYRSNDEEAEKTVKELQEYGTKVISFKGDVADPACAEEAAKTAKEKFGKIDILVNNAGITNDKLMLRMSPEDFKKVIDVNLNGSFNFMKYAGGIMMKQRSGCIINMSSISGIEGNPAQINYSASKAGIIGMTKSAAKEMGRRGIRVNAIAPGFIETDMTNVLSEDQKKEAAKNISLGRTGKPEDIAGAALFLASDLGGYVTGQVIGVDGGLII